MTFHEQRHNTMNDYLLSVFLCTYLFMKKSFKEHRSKNSAVLITVHICTNEDFVRKWIAKKSSEPHDDL